MGQGCSHRCSPHFLCCGGLSLNLPQHCSQWPELKDVTGGFFVCVHVSLATLCPLTSLCRCHWAVISSVNTQRVYPLPRKYRTHMTLYSLIEEIQYVHYLKAAIVNICALLRGLCVKFRWHLLITDRTYNTEYCFFPLWVAVDVSSYYRARAASVVLFVMVLKLCINHWGGSLLVDISFAACEAGSLRLMDRLFL